MAYIIWDRYRSILYEYMLSYHLFVMGTLLFIIRKERQNCFGLLERRSDVWERPNSLEK